MPRMIDLEAAEIRSLAAKIEGLVKIHGSTEEAAREIGFSVGMVNHFRRLAQTRVNRTFSSTTVEKIKRANGSR